MLGCFLAVNLKVCILLHGAIVRPEHRQQLEAIFAFMCKYQRETGYPPSLRETGKAFYMSPGTIMRYLDKMEAQGWVTREWGKARGITLKRECAKEETFDD
jgi:SOS-response transcriptional repressor LexA